MAEADVLRKIMGKKQKEKIPKEREKFLDRCKQNNIDIKKAQEIFDLMEKFAEYGFNKSHSTAYAYIAFQTAYLKYYYPQYFILESLNNDIGNKENAKKYIEEALKFGIDIMPPDINKSESFFTLENDNTIRFGLLAIEEIGKAIVNSIAKTKKECNEFKDLLDFLDKVDKNIVNITATQNLVKAGCFDNIPMPGNSRNEALNYIAKYYEQNKKENNKTTSKKNLNNQILPIFADKQPKQKEKKTVKVDHSKIKINNPPMETTQDDKIEQEIKMLGISVENIKTYKNIFGQIQFFGNLNNNNRELKNREKFTIFGIIKDKPEAHDIKDNKKVMYASCYTPKETINLTIFDDKIQRDINQITSEQDKRLLKITCEANTYKNKKSYIVKKIEKIDVNKQLNALLLIIDSEKQTNPKESLKNIKDIIDFRVRNQTHRLLFLIKQNGYTLIKTNSFITPDVKTLHELKKYSDNVLLVNFQEPNVVTKVNGINITDFFFKKK